VPPSSDGNDHDCGNGEPTPVGNEKLSGHDDGVQNRPKPKESQELGTPVDQGTKSTSGGGSPGNFVNDPSEDREDDVLPKPLQR